MPRVPSRDLADKLDTQGGFTLDERRNQYVETGWMSSREGYEEAHAPVYARQGAIDTYRQRNARVLRQRGTALGGWRDDDRNVLDVTTVHGNPVSALQHGHENRQYEVFGLATGPRGQNYSLYPQANPKGGGPGAPAHLKPNTPEYVAWNRHETDRLRAEHDGDRVGAASAVNAREHARVRGVFSSMNRSLEGDFEYAEEQAEKLPSWAR